MIDRSAIAQALAKAIAYKQCGKQFQTFETALDRARRHYAEETMPLVEA